MKHELKPVEQPFPDDIAKVLDRYPRGTDGYILQLFRVFANSMRFLTDKGPLNLLDRESPLSLREREIVILRVTANNHCEYEWGVHVAIFSSKADLSEEQIAATHSDDSKAVCWTHEESLLIDCVDQLGQNAMIDDQTYRQFQHQWDLEQQLEILALCGNYHLISCVANVSRLAPEPMAARFGEPKTEPTARPAPGGDDVA